MATHAQASRSVLRRLIRAQRAAFEGDIDMQRTAMVTIREKFHLHRHANDDEVPSLLEQAEEAISFLRNNVVQAPLNHRGNYTVDAAQIDESKPREPA